MSMETSARQTAESAQEADGSTLGQRPDNRAARRLKPMLSRPAGGKWTSDADLETGHGQLVEGTSRWKTLLLAFQTLGIVYGDIGTSPLYTFAGIFSGSVPTTKENVEGAASLIIWTLIAILCVKYAIIVLRADDNGQGGSFALYAQLRRQGTPALEGANWRKGGMKADMPKDWRQKLIEHKFTQRCLLVAVVLGVGLIIGDGVLTPAVSVVSAIEGLQTGFPSITRGTIVGVSVAILLVLFAVQQFGTSKIGYSFAPIVAVWFAFNSVIGAYNIAKYQPSIFKVLGPNYWFAYFLRNGTSGWQSLSGVILCITGSEALFADLGHFSRASIQIGVFCVVMPALILTYLGQAAYLIAHPENVSNTFYANIPGRVTFWIMLVVATCAAVVASQALISAVFQIVRQAIVLSFFPRFRVKQTSTTHAGQIYIAVMNYMLMVLTIIIVVTFRTSAKLGLAYGLAINFDFLLTSCFLTLVMLTVWRTNVLLPIAFFLAYVAIEFTFLSSTILKVPKGGWFSLMMAGIYGYLMLLWFWGSSGKSAFFASTRRQLNNYLKVKRLSSSRGESEDTLVLLSQPETPVQRSPGCELYYSDAIRGVPHSLTKLVELKPSLPSVTIFMTIRHVPLPEVLPAERYLVEQLGAPGFYHVIARYGYTQRVHQGEETVSTILQHILALLYRTFRKKIHASPDASVKDALLEHPVSLDSIQVAEFALGDMHGGLDAAEPEADMAALNGNSITMGGLSMSLSVRNLDTRSAMARSLTRPTILGVQWPSGGPGKSAGGATTYENSGPQEAGLAPAVEGSPTVTIQSGNGDKKGSFEREMKLFGENMGVAFTKYGGAAGASEQLEVLGTLAREIALVAGASLVGCKAHVVGRSHLMEAPSKNFLRRYGLVLPFDFLSRVTEKDIATTFSIDDAKLLEIGLKYTL